MLARRSASPGVAFDEILGRRGREGKCNPFYFTVSSQALALGIPLAPRLHVPHAQTTYREATNAKLLTTRVGP